MKLMSLNLWNNITLSTSKNNYKKRASVVAKIIKRENIDIIFTQEMSSNMRSILSKRLPSYNFIYNSRKNGKNEEANCIIIKNNIEVSESKIYSLSNTPDKPNSKFLLDFFPRTLNYVSILINNNEYSLLNTHLDNVFKINRKLQLNVIKDIIKNNDNVILAGDFNMSFNKVLQDFSEDLKLKDYTNKLGSTYRYLKNKKPIDHIFLSDEIIVKDIYKYEDNINGVYPSDHYPIIIII